MSLLCTKELCWRTHCLYKRTVLTVQNGQINTTVASLLVFTAETLDGKPPFYLFIYLKFIICWQIYKIYYKNILLIYCNYAKNSAC